MADETVHEFPTRQTLERYNELSTAWDIDGLIDMWAEDGVLKLVPLALGEFHGRDEIESHYRSRPITRPWELNVDRIMVDGPHAYFEVSGHIIATGDEFHVVDHVIVTPDGKLQSVTGFIRKGPGAGSWIPGASG
jgi:hypothetical protein